MACENGRRTTHASGEAKRATREHKAQARQRLSATKRKRDEMQARRGGSATRECKA